MTDALSHKPTLVSVYMIYGSKYWGDYTELSISLMPRRTADVTASSNVVRFIRPVNQPMRHPDGLPNR
jgi:hypothetical protein